MSDTQEIADLRAEVERLRGVVMSALDIARGDHEKTPTLYNVEVFLHTALLTAAPVATDEPAQEGGEG